MRNFTKRLLIMPLLLVAGICFFSATASKPIEKPECGERECCKKKNMMPTCDVKASGTEFGVFDAASRLFTAKS